MYTRIIHFLVSSLSFYYFVKASRTGVSQQLCTPGLRYPDIKAGMPRDDFKKWTIVQLREFLGDHCINKDGNKVNKAYGTYITYMMNLPANQTLKFRIRQLTKLFSPVNQPKKVGTG